jgi:hypothetical protein
MNDSSEPVRIKLYSADYALGEENLNQITKEIWREIRERSKGRGTLVRDQDLPEGAKIAVAGIAATVAIEYVVGKSVRYLIDVLIETLRKKMQEKHIKGNVGAKIQVGRKVVDITPHMRRADIDAQLNRLPARNGRSLADALLWLWEIRSM